MIPAMRERTYTRKPRIHPLVILAFVVGGLACLIVCGAVVAKMLDRVQAKPTSPIAQLPPVEEERVGSSIRTVKLRASFNDEFVVQGICELSTEYLGDFRASRQEKYAIRITQDDPADSMYLYLARKDKQAERIFELLIAGPKKMTFRCMLTGRIDTAEVRKVISIE